ncbi:MAG: radical SAM protein, partial [Pseudomonadota bacterium]
MTRSSDIHAALTALKPSDEASARAAVRAAVDADGSLSDSEALRLSAIEATHLLAAGAAELRDKGFGSLVTYSRKVFIPLTHLCRDVCHYCTFAQVPREVKAPYMSVDEVLEVARNGAEQGCQEALFTLGEKPELRYRAAREALAEMGFESTLHYLRHCAERVFEETGLLPHLNPGNLTPEELDWLRPVSPSMGIMLES